MSEATPLLATKLYCPPAPPNVVRRSRLLERLNAGLHRKLTLVAAPAGFGKTTLLSEWLNHQGEGGRMQTELAEATLAPARVAWLSLEARDNDPTRFLTYLVAAVQTVAPHIGTGVAAVLHSSPPPESAGREALLTALLNDITTRADKFVLVLDDYHLVEAGGPLGEVDQMLTFLVEHLSPQMHLVIATREDPPLPLARLRARGHLTELRAADLRFTPTEAADFLNQVMGLNLSGQDVATLEARTEGWIAGLQLAALSLQDHQDVPAFIRAFSGDHRYILDYLVEEVLLRQPDAVRTFLLHTAILDRLTGSLCDAVTDQPGGKARLETLQRGNFFLIPLDETRHWYRYHHLFADVLQMHLLTEQPDQVPVLHRRASAWYEQHGLAADAIRHAFAAEDFGRAADLVELAWSAMRRGKQEAALLRWMQALPAAVFYWRPVLSVAYAHALLASGKREGVEERLLAAERWLETTAALLGQPTPTHGAPGSRPAAETRPESFAYTQDKHSQKMIVLDDEEFRRLPATIAIARAGLALAQGDGAATMTYARQVLDLVPADDHLRRGGAAGFLGLATWARGDLEAAYRSYAEGMAHLQMAGNVADAVGGAIALADIRMAQGRLHEAMQIYARGFHLATQGASVLRGVADMHVGMSQLHRERNDLDTATQHLLSSQALGEHTGFPQYRYRWRVAMACIREAQGDLDSVLDLLTAAERVYVSDFFPNVRPVAALKTRVWLAQGRVSEALGWVREQGLSAADDLSYLREFEHITLARVLLAQYQREHIDRALREAIGLLARLLEAAEAGERSGSVLEILVLQALAHQLHGDLPAALLLLERALTLAEPEDYVRIFVDEGPLMAELLTRLKTADGRMKAYIHTLLAAFRTPKEVHPSSSILPPLVEPLSERELDVLRLLGTELNGPEMAHKLMVSLNTLRTHTKNIYSKLGVNNRQAAIRRASELDLL